MGLHETRKLLHQIEEAPIEWEQIFVSYISDKELIRRMYREFKKTPKFSKNQ
jgi:hypothetical protein